MGVEPGRRTVERIRDGMRGEEEKGGCEGTERDEGDPWSDREEMDSSDGT